MKPRSRSRRSLHGVLMATALALATGTNAQLAHTAARSLSHGDHENDGLEELLHAYDSRLEFAENKGQFSSGVLYRADFPYGQALATPEGMLVKVYDPEAVRARQEEGMRAEQDLHAGLTGRPLVAREKGHAWRLHFLGALPGMRTGNRDAHSDTRNYFIGGSEALNVRTYQEVWYTGVYRGIDVRYYPAADGSLEYDIICAPGSDPGAIAIEHEGIEQMRVSDAGELVLMTSLGEMTLPAPVVYQKVGGHEKRIKASYRITGNNVLSFVLGAYDRALPLIIDPIAMRWATWVNTASSGANHGHCIWVDPNDGAIYVAARPDGSTDQITLGAFDVSANGGVDLVVGKYLEPGSVGGTGTRVWQTYIGGNGQDNPYAMEQGSDGHLYITGLTASTNFPVLGGSAFTGSSINQQSQSGEDIFVLKLTTDGQSMKAAVVGGNGTDNSFDIRTTSGGDVLVCGSTTSTNLSTLNSGAGASNTNNGGTDAIVFRINQDLSSLTWMRNYGGDGADRASIMLHDDATGDLFIGGNTASSNFPTVSPRQSTRGGTAAGFLQRLNGNTAAVNWSSYYSSSSGNTNLLCMEFNTTRTELYFGGVTAGLDAANISGGAYDASYNTNNDFYVGRMAIDQTFLGGTYLGGTGEEVNMMGLNVDQNNDVYVFGYTASSNFPVSALPNTPLLGTTQGGQDKVFLKLEYDLGSLLFSTYYGGGQDDTDPVGQRGIKFSNCRIYTIVTARSNNIPLTQGALNTTKGSSTSVFEPGLVVWANPPDLLGNSITYQGVSICPGSVPGDITGSVPSYVLPTIIRNGTTSSYPSFGNAATYQWQISLDSLNWTDIPGATGQDLSGSMIGAITQDTYIRRVIGGDACILAGAADQVVKVKLMTVGGTTTDALCNGTATGSATADADGLAPFGYLWSNGQTDQTAVNLAAGNYTVTVTDANGCSAQGQFIVGQPTAVGGNIQTTPATCGASNGSATVSGTGGTPGYSYLWSTGAAGSNLSNVPAGNYEVTVTDANQCTAVLPVVIGGTSNPEANAGADAEITCTSGGEVQLNGSSMSQNVSFTWSGPNIVSGANTATPVVNEGGTYTLTVTNTITGCFATDQVEVTEHTTPPGATAQGGTLNCNVLSIQLTGGGNGTFAWTGPNGFTSNDQNPVVNTAGTYNLVVTGANGCTSQASAVVELDNAAPGAQAAGGTLTCTTTSVQLMGTGNGTFAWTGPNGFTSNDQNPVVSTAGTYNLVVTGANGCTSQASAVVELDNAAPGAQAAGGVLNCTNNSVQLQGTGNGTFAWTGPNGFTSNDQSPVVNTAGTYNLVVTGANGCTSQASAVVELDNAAPGAQAAGGTLTCTTTSVQLFGTGNGTFAWTGPNGFTSNDQNPVVSTAGTYNLVVTGANGCTSQASAVVELDNAAPGAQAAGGTLTCTTTSVQLMGTGNGTFAWTGPNGFTSNDQNPVVSTAGTYNLVVTGANGCTSQASAVVELDNAAPGAQAAGGVLNCTNNSVQLQGTGNGTFAWTGPNGFTSNDQSPVVNTAGTYNLVVTGANGCTSQASAVVELDNAAPGAQAAGGTLTCTTTSVQLFGTGNGTFAWTGPNGFTSNDQNPVVSTAGTYNLVVTGANGCTSQASAVVELDNAAPGAQAAGGTLTCTNTSVQLLGSGNGTFAWTGPNGFISNDQNPVVSTAGTYNLVVTGANGCTSQASAVVELDNAAPGAQAAGGVLNCTNNSVQLLGTGNGTFAWTGPDNFTSSQQNPVVGMAGIYVLTVTGANGCTSMAEAVVEQDDQVPGAQAIGGTLTCTTTSVQLLGSGNGTFAWTGPNGFASNDQNPVVNTAGTYNLVVTGANGCTSQASAVVELDNAAPGAQAAGGTLTCTTTSVQLMGTGNGTFAWTGPNGFTSNDQNPVVNTAGTYNLVVTGANGCTSQASAVVELDNAAPGAQAAGGTLTCTTTSVQLMGTGNGTFAWTGPNGFTSNDQNPVVSTAGTYNLVVTGANGCTSQASAVVELDNAAPGAQAAGGVLNCTNNSVQLQGTGNGTFAWTGPNGFTSNDQNPVVNTAGTYNLVVTGANGCTSQASAVVELDNAAPGAQAAGGTLTCTTTSVQLMGTGNGTFAWTGPNGFTSNDQNPVVSTAGTYNLVVTGANGCTSQASAVVELDNAAPGAQAAGGTLTCTTTSVQLLGTGNGTFAWTGPNGFTSNDQNPVVNTAGTYNLVVTGANGCTSEATTVVEMDNAAPVAIAYGGSLTCDASSVQLTGIGTGTFSWVGPNGFSSTDANPIVDVAGIYTLTVTGENGCSATAATDVTDATGDLQLTTQGGEVPCSGDGVTISASADGEVEYTWTGPLGFTGSGPEVLVYDEGVYTVVATADGGCTATAEVVVTAEICNKECGPIITWCPPPMEVACGTSLEPDSIGYPGIRKDKDCPTVVFITYSDVTLGYCPQTVTRTWTLSDETGATEYCTQVFTVIDNVAPVLHNVPGNITVSCDAVPDKDDAVWAEDACQPTADVYICDVVEGLDNKCSYTITRTYYAMDYCGNFSSATQTIHVIDDSAPVFDCDLASEVIADCKDIPVKTDCQAWDACDASVDVTIEEAYGYDDKSKECYLVRTYTATDDCGNASTMSQTIHLVGECCDHKGKGDKKLMEVSVSPNPFRTECVISFRALEAGRATVTITDLNGRPVSSAITQDVSAGQDVRIPFSAAQVEMGVYQFRVIIGDRTATGRLIVQ